MIYKDIWTSVTEFLNFKDSYSLGKTCKSIYNERFFTQDFYINRLNLDKKEKEYIIKNHNQFIFYCPCTIILYIFSKWSIEIIFQPIGSSAQICRLYDSIYAFTRDMREIKDDDSLKLQRTDSGQLGIKIGTFNPRVNDFFGVGSFVDAMDNDAVWYEARIMRIKNNLCKIRFRNWSSDFDIYIDKKSPMIAPPYSFVENWRSKITKGSEIMYKIKYKWYNVVVESIEDDNVTISSKFIKQTVLNIQSDRIAPKNIHGARDYRLRNFVMNKKYDNGDAEILYDPLTRRLITI